MKGIPIKFRGVVYCSCDEKVFGELTHQNGSAYIRAVDGEYHYRVDENTISQLVGYDAEGNEVYEGDKVRVGDEIVKVEWCNECTCFAVKWKNGTSDSYGTVFYRYYDKPYLVKENE